MTKLPSQGSENTKPGAFLILTLYISINSHCIPKRDSNLCVGAWLLVNNSQWLTPVSHCLKLHFLVPSNVLLSSLLVCFPNCVVSLSLSSCFGILCLLFQLYEWLHTFVLWISLLQILKDFNVPKCSCYRFYPTIWCTIWHADGTDETTLQAVNFNMQNGKAEENI